MRVSKFIGKTTTYLNVQLNRTLRLRLTKGGCVIKLLGLVGYPRGGGWFRFWGNPIAEGRDLSQVAARMRRVMYRMLEEQSNKPSPMDMVRDGFVRPELLTIKRVRPVKMGYMLIGTQMRKMPIAVNRAVQVCEEFLRQFVPNYQPPVRFAHKRSALPAPKPTLNDKVKALQARFSRHPEEAYA